MKEIDLNIGEIWTKLETGSLSDGFPAQRKYRRLELRRESGIRLGYVSPDGILEILIQTDSADENAWPDWKGMRFEKVVLDVPEKNTNHIRLFLTDREHRDVFVTVCEDLIRNLDFCEIAEQREKELRLFLKRWTRFFQRGGQDGLSPSRQRGLFGELWWLNRMIIAGIDRYVSVCSWKGCDSNSHDFLMGDNALEVKTTMTKEPRRVQISSEKQLDDQGLNSLHLFVLTLLGIDRGTASLPDLVKQIRAELSDNGAAGSEFERSLIAGGYLDMHAPVYAAGYTVKKQELFLIQGGFPRIVSLPDGTGDLRYSLTVSTCTEFKADIDKYLAGLSKD